MRHEPEEAEPGQEDEQLNGGKGEGGGTTDLNRRRGGWVINTASVFLIMC